MDEQTQKIEEYIKKLPKEVQDFIAGNEWENRVNEISKKYALDAKQSEALSNNTMLLLVGLSDPENLTKNIEEDLGISGLLSEQIFEDLEKRVFDYALKILEKKPEIKKQTSAPIVSKIPEIRPENLPAQTTKPPVAQKPTENKISIPKYAPVSTPVNSPAVSTYKPTGISEPAPKPASPVSYSIPKIPPLPDHIVVQHNQNDSVPQKQEVKTETKINYSPVTPETIQKPAFVPRLDLSSEKISVPIPTPPINSPASSIIDNKLNAVTPSIKTDTAETPKENPIVKQYTVDPYREPMV
jgi:hypothetical protein